MQTINLALAFLLELIAFLGFAGVGFLLPVAPLLQIIIALVLFISLIIFWSRFMSPKAVKKVNLTAYYLIKFAIYAAAAFTISRLYGYFGSILFFVASLLNDGLLFNYNKDQF
jgi:hypothetical protein